MYALPQPRHAARTVPLALAGRGALALALGAVALANLFSFLLTSPLGANVSLDRLTGGKAHLLGRAGVVVAAALLLLVARAALKGKRQAWWLAVGLCAVALLSAVLNHRQWGYVLALLLVLVGQLALAPLFPMRSDRHASLRGYAAVTASVCLIATFPVVNHLILRSLLSTSLRTALLDATRLVAVLVLTYGVLAMLRPVLRARRALAADRERAASIVAACGRQAVAHFALGADKSYYWSPTRRSLLAFRVACGVALVLGDPIGPAEEHAFLIRDFLAYCRRQDWAVALYQTTPETQHLYRRAGLRAHKIGEEALVDLAAFTTEGKVGAPVRHAVSRARRGGLTVCVWHGEAIPDEIFAGMERVSAAWLGGHQTSSQMGFSMGRFPADWSPDLLTAAALDAEGRVQAFVSWTPLHAANGWALDNMRRLPDATPGAMEYLIAESFAWAKARACARMSLGLVPLAGLADALATAPARPDGATLLAGGGPSLFERGAAFLNRRNLLLGSYTSLYRFKGQFQVTWEPRYLVVADLASLPRVLRALAWVHSYTGWGMLKDAWAATRPLRKLIVWARGAHAIRAARCEPHADRAAA